MISLTNINQSQRSEHTRGGNQGRESPSRDGDRDGYSKSKKRGMGTGMGNGKLKVETRVYIGLVGRWSNRTIGKLGETYSTCYVK